MVLPMFSEVVGDTRQKLPSMDVRGDRVSDHLNPSPWNAQPRNLLSYGILEKTPPGTSVPA